MAFIKVDWERLDTNEYPFVWQIIDFCDATTPEIEGDELLMFKNTYNDQYCMYWKLANDGERLCLAQHITLCHSLFWYEGDGGHDENIAKEMLELVNQKADDAGFPKNWHDLPCGMTWKELVTEILKHPELLDERVRVWTPIDMPPECDFSEVSGITSYDCDETPADKENFLSIDLIHW